jgi:hypothetical protein
VERLCSLPKRDRDAIYTVSSKQTIQEQMMKRTNPADTEPLIENFDQTEEKTAVSDMSDETENRIASFTKWNIIKAFVDSLAQTGEIYEYQGLVVQAEYYYSKVFFIEAKNERMATQKSTPYFLYSLLKKFNYSLGIGIGRFDK